MSYFGDSFDLSDLFLLKQQILGLYTHESTEIGQYTSHLIRIGRVLQSVAMMNARGHG